MILTFQMWKLFPIKYFIIENIFLKMNESVKKKLVYFSISSDINY